MSDELDKPPRREPVLQAMRIVQVPETPPTSISTSVPMDKKGKPLVIGKKEYEKAKQAANKPKLPYKNPVAPDHVIAEANATRIDDLDRNSKLGRNVEEQAPDFDLDWVKQSGGKLVTIAWLQTAVSASGFISSESTFSPQKIRGLTMAWNDKDLLVKIENTNGVFEGFIPGANVKLGKF